MTSVTGASRFLIGLVACFVTHDGIPAGRARVKRLLKVPSDAQPTAKQTSVTLRSPRRSSATALDTPRNQVAVRQLAVCESELAADVLGRHVRAAGERLDVQRLRVLPVDPITNAAQPREVESDANQGRVGAALRRVCFSPARSCHVAPEVPSAAGVPPHSASALARSAPLRPPSASTS